MVANTIKLTNDKTASVVKTVEGTAVQFNAPDGVVLLNDKDLRMFLRLLADSEEEAVRTGLYESEDEVV